MAENGRILTCGALQQENMIVPVFIATKETAMKVLWNVCATLDGLETIAVFLPKTTVHLPCILLFVYRLDTSKIPIIVGVAGGGGLLLAAIIIIAAALLVKRRRRRIKLDPPDYTKFMFYPGTATTCENVNL